MSTNHIVHPGYLHLMTGYVNHMQKNGTMERLRNGVLTVNTLGNAMKIVK